MKPVDGIILAALFVIVWLSIGMPMPWFLAE